MPRPSVLERSVEIAAPAALVFAFHLDTRNAALISPAGTRVVSVEGSFPVEAGGLVTMRMRQRPVPVTVAWRIRIESVEPDRRIVDTAESSPFALWRHEHLFRELGPDRTLMTDRVTYGLPAGRLGRLIDRLLVRRRLERAFAERHRRTRDLLEERVRAGAAGEHRGVTAARPTVVWFRRDLRVADHPALRDAADAGPVACLYVLDPALLARRHHRAPARLRFLRAGLEALDGELRSRGSRLVVRHGRPEEVVPAAAAEAGAGAVHVTRDVSPYARVRDGRVEAALRQAGVVMRAMPGDLLAQPEDLPGSSGHGYRVFTPFHRAWRQAPVPPHVPAPRRIEGPELPGEDLGLLPAGDPPIPAGPAAARARLVAFVTGSADAYPARRDLLAEDATSRLSAYLRFGMCTPAQIGRALGLPGSLPTGREGFWRQVCWRDFYHHHLARNPEVARQAFVPELRRVRWDDDPADLAAWAAGETGYPLVDAGMRQLAQEAWIHNRARMVVASFLAKDLLVDWRRGETAFMQGLVDGDPANNNGGWQWTAGTGTDAAPYFRVLSPVRQARRFDPDGDYVRRYVPELRDVPDSRIFEPWTMTAEEERAAGCRIGSDYPAPRVDHAQRREMALERYREARGDG